jgi:hypothetical protein
MNLSYLPNTDSDRVVWLNNLNNKLSVYATTLNITPADLAQTGKDYAMYAYIINTLDLLKQSQQNATAFKNMLKHAGGQLIGNVPTAPNLGTAPAGVPAGVFDRVRLLVQRIKNHPAYTEATGQDLNIIAPADTTDVNTIVPVLTSRLDVGRPHLKWQRSIADATDIYADHNDGNGFVLAGRFVHFEYLDTMPLAAGKIADDFKYKAIYVIADEQVGQMSQVVTVRAMKQ